MQSLCAGAMTPALDPQSPAGKEDQLKNHFLTREGTQVGKKSTTTLGFPTAGTNVGSAPVRVSFLSVAPSTSSQPSELDALPNGDRDSSPHSDPDRDWPDRICFNVGRELYVYTYRAADLSKPLDKRVYKGTYPTCHDFNSLTATCTSCSLLIGFSAGQIQLIDPFQKDFQTSRLYNEDRFIDKTRVTCLKWVPGQATAFLAAHASGNLYLYEEDLPCSPGAPAYQVLKQGEGYCVHTCKTKTTRNPLAKWTIGEGAVNEFAFSGADAKFLATVGHDGFLRLFNYHSLDLIGYMKSYFGGLLCVAWSPDAKYIVTGGEDDLITVYSVGEKRIVCRGQGHKSWISQVAFDPYTSCVNDGQTTVDLGEDDDTQDVAFRAGKSAGNYETGTGGSAANLRIAIGGLSRTQKESVSSMSLGGAASAGLGVTYRIGSVGHDTQLCLWDLSDDVLRSPVNQAIRHRNSTIVTSGDNQAIMGNSHGENCKASSSEAKEGKPDKLKKLHKRGFSLGARLAHDRWGRGGSHATAAGERERKEDAVARMLGTAVCPRMDDVQVIEPLICKKIAHERLTVLQFRDECIVTACQEGFICTWARPGKGLRQRASINSPNPGGSPNIPGGTVV